MRTLGIDLGGTNIKVCLLEAGPRRQRGAGTSEEPRVLVEKQTETRAELGPEAVLDRMAEIARQVIAATGPVDAVGVGAPGPLDLEAGRVVFMANLPGWERRPIVDALEERLSLPVALINDVRACTLAELELGAGRGCRNLVVLALGTGVGGGIVVHGELLLGLNGTIGEIGHQTVEPDGLPCPCGNHGCLEQYVSGPSIARSAGTQTAEEALAAARGGDRRAAAAIERAGTYLGIGIANVVLAVGPERVVIGGGVAAAGDLLLEPARREFARRNRVMPIERVSIVPSKLGPLAGAVGAALWGARAGRDRRR